MPTYEYSCSSCGHRFETFQSMSAEPLVDCPECGEAELRRVIGVGAGIIFKGSGFYQTDYRKSSESSDGNGSAPAKKDGGKETAAPAKSDSAAGG